MNTKILSIFCLMFSVLGLFLQACTEEPTGQQPVDSVAPGEVTEVTSKRIAGGAVVYYTLPSDEDLLYVKAVYSLQDGEKREVRASVYQDSLEIAGFGDTIAREIQLIAVDRSKNESQPVPTTIQPLTPPVHTICETLRLVADFGGIHAYWDNPTKANISVHVMTKDKNDEYVPLDDPFYSAKAIGDALIDGLDTVPIDVITYVQDRWGNRSETKDYSLTPLFQTLFDRMLHKSVRLADDVLEHPNYTVERLFDGNKNGDPCFAAANSTGIWPQWLTMDMGVVGKLSRVRIYQRTGGTSYIFGEGNWREFEIYGRLDFPDLSGDMSGWTKLLDCVSVKPSGLPAGTKSDEDIAKARNGEDFYVPIDAPKVRYIRILVKEIWSGMKNSAQMGEIEFYGDNR